MEPHLLERVLDLAVQVQQIPAPTFFESGRAKFVQERFLSEGLTSVGLDQAGNVLGCLKGRGESRPLVVSAHLDTVFPFGVDLAIRRTPGLIQGPGIGDNSLGVAGLFGLLWFLRSQPETLPLPGDLWLVANTGEEGLGNLRGMFALVERFGKEALAYLVIEGMSFGQVFNRGLGVQRYRIQVNTPGGHSWVDYGKPSAVHELVLLANRLVGLPLPKKPRTSLNIGVISGGTTVNTIAATATLELDLRSENVNALTDLSSEVQHQVQSLLREQVCVECTLIGQRPAGKLSSRHPLVLLAQRCLETQGVPAPLNIGSTDANAPLSQGFPAVCVGLTRGSGAHTLQEQILTSSLAQGLNQLAMLVNGAFREL
jgi:acetylornithine deacetylase/succinyl-diaminopimelate desuccinylase-like protein